MNDNDNHDEHGLLGSNGCFKVAQITQMSQKLGRPDGLKIKAKIILKIKAVGILSDNAFSFVERAYES